MGAEREILRDAVAYMNIRWLGAPAILLMLALFGVLRGLQDMTTPLWVALGTNALNILLDWLLVFGAGPVPAMGVEGAATASVISQWIGAAWTMAVLFRYHKPDFHIRWKSSLRLLKIGGDLFVRTGLLTLFLIVTTRAATRAGADSGAAHQAIRQFWASLSPLPGFIRDCRPEPDRIFPGCRSKVMVKKSGLVRSSLELAHRAFTGPGDAGWRKGGHISPGSSHIGSGFPVSLENLRGIHAA